MGNKKGAEAPSSTTNQSRAFATLFVSRGRDTFCNLASPTTVQHLLKNLGFDCEMKTRVDFSLFKCLLKFSLREWVRDFLEVLIFRMLGMCSRRVGPRVSVTAPSVVLSALRPLGPENCYMEAAGRAARQLSSKEPIKKRISCDSSGSDTV